MLMEPIRIGHDDIKKSNSNWSFIHPSWEEKFFVDGSRRRW